MQSDDFDYLHRIGDGYAQIRRYAPAFLDALHMKAAPAARDILAAVETLKTLNADHVRKVLEDAPTGFVKKRWERLVFTDEGVDRRFYELCALSELKNALRSGDIWVQGSRQFKDSSTPTCCRRTSSPRSSRPTPCRWPWRPTATNTCMTGCSCLHSNWRRSTPWPRETH
jgi:hypothetical protein